VRTSRRIPPDLTPTPLARALAASGAASPVVDLTLSNPTLAGLTYDRARILAALGDAESLRYEPAPLGRLEARQAVVEHLLRQGRAVPLERVVLTASTSEAYAVLMKLLCDPGDAIAVPAPSYPLVPHLAELEGVRPLTYRLLPCDGWRIDFASLAAVLDEGVRAVVVVSPNNPTGSVVGDADAQELRQRCQEAGVALIVDEVFWAYRYGASGPSPFARDQGPLTFVLDGLSKAAALPQLKLGWMTLHGVESALDTARAGLEWLLDASLSVSTPVQVAARELLATAAPMQAQIRARLAQNRVALAEACAGLAAVRLLPAEAGWYAVLELGERVDEEGVVERLATCHAVIVHPGFFYDFVRPGYLVASLLPEPTTFARGAAALQRYFASRSASD